MPIGTGLALGLGAMSLAGGIGSAAIGSNAAGNASNAQVQASQIAADEQRYEANQNLDFQKSMWNTEQSNMAPWLNIGGQGENSLAELMGLSPYNAQSSTSGGGGGYTSTGATSRFAPGPGGGTNWKTGGAMPMTGAPGGPSSGALNGGPTSTLQAPGTLNRFASTGGLPANRPGQLPGGSNGAGGPMSGYRDSSGNLVPLGPWTEQFQAPTDVTEQNDPGYQFRLKQGEDALNNSAAAKGTLLSGAGIKPYERFAQDYASTEYGNVYNRAFNQFTNRYNINANNQADEWNRFAALAGLGQTSASTLNAGAGQIAGNVGSMYTNLGSELGQDANNAGAARASGYVGAGNAWGGGLSGGTNSLMDMIMMSQMKGMGSGYDPNAPVGS